MVRYQVRLPESTVEVAASTVNLGIKRLWFWNDQKQLVAVFSWDKIVGFEVLGSAQDQVFTDALLHEKEVAGQPRESAQAPVAVFKLLGDLGKTLSDAKATVDGVWLQVYSDRRNKRTEIGLLARGKEDELRRLQAQIIDGQKSLDKSLEVVLNEIKALIAGQAD